MVDVFLSYAAQDREIATQVHRKLSDAGIVIWHVDSALNLGEDLDGQIRKAVGAAAVGLLVLSLAAVNSPSVAREYRYVLSLNKRLYIALIEPVPLQEIPHYLRDLKYVDLSEAFDKRMSALIKAIKSAEDIPDSKTLRQADIHGDQTGRSVSLEMNLKDTDAQKVVEIVKGLLDAGVPNVKVVNSDR